MTPGVKPPPIAKPPSPSGHPLREGLRKVRELAWIVVSLLSGATVGAILSPRLLNHTLWVIVLPPAMVLGMAPRRSAHPTTRY